MLHNNSAHHPRSPLLVEYCGLLADNAQGVRVGRGKCLGWCGATEKIEFKVVFR